MSIIALWLMAADQTGAAAIVLCKIDRDRPLTKIGRDEADKALLIATVNIVTDLTATPFILVDMQFMEISLTVIELCLIGAGVFSETFGMAAEAERVVLGTIP